MNLRLVVNQLCALQMVLGVVLLLVAGGFYLVQWFRGEEVNAAAKLALFFVGGGGLVGAFFVWWMTRPPRGGSEDVGRREALLLVALSWLLGAGYAALPFWVWAHLDDAVPPGHPFLNYVDCYFESMSGLTTVGASVLTDIEAVPHALLLWRAFTQWIGGVGIVVVFIAVLPSVGVGAKRLFFNEVSGPVDEGVMPTIRSTARVLLQIYSGMTAVLIVALLLCGMSSFDALCHALSTISTGGFSPKNASTGHYDSAAVDIVITIFMILGGVNFALYYHLLRRKYAEVLADRELRLYFGILAACTIVVAAGIVGRVVVKTTGEHVEAGVGYALQAAVFNVVSVQTTTGFATADFDRWPDEVRAVIAFVCILGGCAGSTAGGLKVIRLLIIIKALMAILERAFRPSVVRPVRIGRSIVDDEVQLACMGFAVGMVILHGVGTLLLYVFEPRGTLDLTTAISANFSTFCNTGPGFGKVGPMANYGWMTDGSKITLSMMMLLGRLEIVTLVALVTPRFWRRV